VAADPEPPELALLLDFAERPRVEGWSLRSALVRYAQADPVRVSQVLELVRRIEAAWQPHAKLFAKEGPVLWTGLSAGTVPVGEPHALVVGTLAAAQQLDQMADRVATWAVDRSPDRPDAAVDRAVADVTARLDGLGVAREERQGPPPRRGRRADS
jgi:hypothetical protein